MKFRRALILTLIAALSFHDEAVLLHGLASSSHTNDSTPDADSFHLAFGNDGANTLEMDELNCSDDFGGGYPGNDDSIPPIDNQPCTLEIEVDLEFEEPWAVAHWNIQSWMPQQSYSQEFSMRMVTTHPIYPPLPILRI